jgi:hypothetical protein
VEFSIRDKRSEALSVLDNQRGQGLIEYVLILVVTVGLILGGLWQLNTAFKDFANNYFGNYLACLLESGELPNISGGGGDGGICNEIFKPFTLAGGRALKPNYKGPGDKEPGKGTGSREGGRGTRVAGYGGSGGGGGGSGSGRFTGGSFGKGSRKRSSASSKKGASGTFTGSTAASDYGSSGSGSRRSVSGGLKSRLDTRFAFEEEREKQRKRPVAGAVKKPGEGGGRKPSGKLRPTEMKKQTQESVDSGLTLPNLLKYLIIAGIIIALVVFLGGQGLQIGKSME